MNWYKTSKLAETAGPNGANDPIFHACANCNKFKNEQGQYISYEEMNSEELQQFEKIKKTIELSDFIRQTNNNAIEIENYLAGKEGYAEVYQDILSGNATRISHGYCPPCNEAELAKYQNNAVTAANSGKKNKKPYIIYKKHRTWPDSEKIYVTWGWATSADGAKGAFFKQNTSAYDESQVGYEFIVELHKEKVQEIEDAEKAKVVKKEYREENIQNQWWNKY